MIEIFILTVRDLNTNSDRDHNTEINRDINTDSVINLNALRDRDLMMISEIDILIL